MTSENVISLSDKAMTAYKDTSYEELMQIDLDLLAKCDAIYLMRGWSQSLGCNRELGYALGRDMIILEGREDASDES